MRVMVMVKATNNSERGVLPSEQLLREMGEFNQQLLQAGVMQNGDGLRPSKDGKRLRFHGGKQSVTDGPFAETKELVAGFWLWQVKSMDEALAWAKRCPQPMPGEDCELELRPLYELEDLGIEPDGQQPKAGNTIRLHRVLCAPPERVYRAFLDPAAKAKWLPPHGFTGTVHEFDGRVGGGYRMSFTNQANGDSHAFGGRYLELVPNQRIRHTDTFDDPNLPGEMTVTVELRAVSCGTDLSIVQENVPAAIPVENCYVGWQQSLQQLALLVEAPVAG